MKRATNTARGRFLLPMLAFGALAFGGACESGFDRNDQIVNSLRILGVKAHVESSGSGDANDWADADAGDTIDFSALVVNPTGDPALTVTWLACLPVPGQISPCTYPPDLRDPTKIVPDPSTGVLLLGTGTDIQSTIPADLSYLLDPLVTRAQMNLNAECGIYTEIPLLVIAQNSTQTFTASKNIRLSPWKEIGMYSTDPTLQFYVRNLNPTAAALFLPSSLMACDGQLLGTFCLTDADCAGVGGTCERNLCTGAIPFPAGPQSVCLKLDNDPLGMGQKYFDCDLDGPVLTAGYSSGEANIPEDPSVIWYTTGGTLAGISGPSNGGTPSLAARTFTGFTRPAGPFTLYGVVRDGRDGEDWIAQDFE